MKELRLIPTLLVSDIEAAISFYIRAFSAEETRRLISPDGYSVLSASLLLGSYQIDVRSAARDHMGAQCAQMSLTLYTSCCSTLYDAAIQEGAKVQIPPQQLPDGSTHAQCIDPFGFQWILRSIPTEN